MDLEQQFQAATERVNNLPPAQAAAHMTELYGLFKQATDGDVNMGHDEVDADEAANPNGPAGLSQAQWEAWNQFKGLPEEDAKRRYVQRAAEVAGGPAAGGDNQQASVPTDSRTGAPSGGSETDNTTTARQPESGPGVSAGGLRGDITAGAPYGGEDKLKGTQDAQ